MSWKYTDNTEMVVARDDRGCIESRLITDIEVQKWLSEGNTPEPADPIIAPVPTAVTMRQARLQLAVLGVYQTVNTAVATMGDAAQIEWEYATEVDRANHITKGIVQLLGWTEEETDDYFAAAALL